MFGLTALLIAISGCQSAQAYLPTLVATAANPDSIGQAHLEPEIPDNDFLPVTWTPVPETTPPTATRPRSVIPSPPTETALPIPTNTPVTPSPTPSRTPSPTPPTPTTSPQANIRPINRYALQEVIPLEAFPRPLGDNGWGIHWIPTVKQEPDVVDRFINEVVRMHIKWVVFLNDGSNIGDNDYLVNRLVDAGIMPVMRIFRSNVSPYDGELSAMVAHYRARGVYYFQLYNEPNVNAENTQGFSNANQYALTWASAARDVIEGGGLPGLGALSPGGAFDHYTFLERTISALRRNGDIWLLNRTWLSVHNYHGLRSLDDEDGFLLFRKYDEIVRNQLNRSIPMIGTEGGSYSANSLVEKDLLMFQYGYMRQAEPYFFAFSHWLLANGVAGSWDDRWEFQTLFRDGFVHPVVTDFFYANRR
ncbi:MAG: hypothetical protein WA996_09270 [Candidatus Promineifilaceae bacterium]